MGRGSGLVAALTGGRRERRAAASEARKLAQRGVRPRQQHVVPLEPRIMMDATLDFGADHALDALDPHAAVSSLLNAAMNVVEEMGAFSDLLKHGLTDLMGDSVDLFAGSDANPFIDSTSHSGDTGSHATDDTFAEFKDFGAEIGSKLLDGIKGEVTTALTTVRGQMATEINAYLDTQLSAYKTTLDTAGSGYEGRYDLTSAEATSLHNSVIAAVNKLGFVDVLDPRAAFAEILGNAGSLGQSLALGPHGTPAPAGDDAPPATPPTLPQLLTDSEVATETGVLKTSLVTKLSTAINHTADDFDTSILLRDIKDGTDTLVGFTQGADNTHVDVSVDLDALVPDLDGLFQRLGIDGDSFGGYDAFKSAYETLLGDLTLDFSLALTVTDDHDVSPIVADADAGTDDDNDHDDAIYHKNFALTASGFTTNLSFGGSIDSSDLEDLSISAGMLSAGITSIDFATFGVDFGHTAFTLSFSTANATLSAAVTDHEGDAVSFGSEAHRLSGDHATTDFNFVDLSITDAGGDDGDDDVLKLAQLGYSAAINWGVVPELEALAPHYSFASVELGGSLAFVQAASGFAVVAGPLSAKLLDENGDEVLESSVLGHAAEWDALDTALTELKTTVEALMHFDGGAYVDVLTNLASGLDVLFESPIFDVALPFLDNFHLSDVLNAYQAIQDTLLEPLHAGLEVIGLSEGNDTSVAGLVLINGIVVDGTDGTVLDAYAGQTLSITIDTASQTVSTTDASTATVPDTFTASIVVPDGGFANLEALAAAITTAFAAAGTFPSDSALSGKHLTDAMSITAARGAIELRAGAGLNAFRVTGNADATEGLGLVERNNVASLSLAADPDDDNVATDLTTLSLDDLVGSDWMKLFTLNLDLVRTTTFDDGSTETINYRTLTLSPSGGEWTVEDLKDQLNDLFEAADIHMVADNGADPDTLTFHVDDDALDTVGDETGKTVADVSYGFAIDGANPSFASSVEVLQALATGFIDDLIPGARFVIDIDEGSLKLVLPEIDFAYMTTFAGALGLDLGALGGLDMSAQFALSASMSLGLTVGVDIVGYANNEDTDKGFADFVFIEDARLDAALGATVTDIEGTGKLGVIEVGIGTEVDPDTHVDSDPSTTNTASIGAALHVTLVGDDDGDYSNRLSFAQIWDEANSQTGIAGMVGAFALTGTAGPDTDQFVYVHLEDITVGISGVNIGIERDIIHAFTASLADLRHPTDWAIDVDSDVANLFESFGKDDVIDSLYNSLVLINQVLGGLVDNMAFLGEEIPVLGVSFIDAMNFTEDLAGRLQDFKNDPNGSLDEIGAALRDALGITDPDGLILHFDGDNNVFWVSLGLSFLDGAEVSYDFTLDLVDLLSGLLNDGNSSDDSLVSNLLDLVSSVANVTGEGTIILDAGATLNLTFGIDLNGILGAPPPVTAATALTALAGVSQITFNTVATNNKGNDVLLSVKRFDGTTNHDVKVGIDLDGTETVGDALYAIYNAIEDAGLEDDIGIVIHGIDADDNVVEIHLDHVDDDDELTEVFGADGIAITSVDYVDLVSQAHDFNIDYDAVEALFGTADDLTPDSDGHITGTADLADPDFDPSAAHSFALVINGSDPIVVAVAATSDGEPDRDFAGFMTELQQVLATEMVGRADIGLGAFGSIPLDKLVTAALVTDGSERHLELTLSNFAPVINGTFDGDGVFTEGDQIELTLTGLSKGATSTVAIENLGGSNLATALGFAPDDSGRATTDDGSLEGGALVANPEDEGVSAFFATEDVEVDGLTLKASGVEFTFIAGVTDGLNMTLAMGPLSVSVVDGHALINGDPDDPLTPASVHLGFNDAADGTEDGRFDLGAVIDAFHNDSADSSDDDIGVRDLFTLTASVYLSVLLPLEDSLGLLDPTKHHIEITGTLLSYNADDGMVGILPALVIPSLHVSDYMDIDFALPNFAAILADLNPFAIINDPLLLTNGLDMILSAIDKTLRKVINAMDLPVVGDSLTQGLDVFNQIKNSILQPILAAASTPDPVTGELPTTIKLLETVVNDALKSLFGLGEDAPNLIDAYLDEDIAGHGANATLYAQISLENFEVFSASLDVGIDLGIPGFNLDMGEASALMFQIIADLHIGFGIDRNGFFFLNDVSDKEISLRAVVSTSSSFKASATLGVVGLSLTANAIEGEDYSGAMIEGEIAIDLFTSLGTAFAGGHYEGDPDTTEDDFVSQYDKVVRLDQLSSSKNPDGEGTKAVAISGGFEVHINFAVTTGISDPLTGEAITALPSAFADFIVDASYQIGGGLEFDRMEFHNLGLNAGDFLKENVLPVLQQISQYISPIHDAVEFLETTKIGPYSLYDIINEAVMKIGGPAAQSALFVFKAVKTISDIIDFINSIGPDGKIYFGDFSLLSAASATGVVDVADTKQVSNLKPTGTASKSFSLNAAMENRGPGITFDLKIFDDVSNVLNLITGNLADVDLFEINLTLLDFTLNVDLKAQIEAAISFIPSEVLDAILGGMNATFYVHAEAGLTVGYDLYGISNFLTSGDVSDIVDGIYFDSDKPLAALEASFNARVGVNFWIIQAGFELGGYFGVSINLNDPNNDGKMRFSEIAHVIESAPSIPEGLLWLIEGDVKGGISASIYYELDFFFFDISDSFELFSFDFTAHFGHTFEPEYLSIDGTTATFNIGAKAGQSFAEAEDGDDVIVFNGDGTVTINSHTVSLGAATSFVIYAGDGNNSIDLSALGAGFTVQYVSGSGNDTVILGDVGGVISTGDGDDFISYAAQNASPFALAAFAGAPYGPGALPPGGSTPGGGTAPTPGPNTASAYSLIKATAGASGAGGVDAGGVPRTNGQTLLIDTGDGADTVDMAGSDQGIVVISGGGLEITAENTATHELERMLFNDWLIATFQGSAPDMAQVLEKIEPELSRYTALWQTKGDDTGDTITTGSGDDLIFAGNGDDTINSGAGNDQVYAGAGNDFVDAGEDEDWVEGGAGADVLVGNEGDDVLLGWGRFDETTTDADFLGLGAADPDLLDQDLIDAIDPGGSMDQEDLLAAIHKFLDGGIFDVDHPDGVTSSELTALGLSAGQLTNLGTSFDNFVKLAKGMMTDDDSDWIEGNAGDDIIHGNGSSDILQGNDGDDLIFGGSDTDIIAGGSVTVTKADNTVLFQTVDLGGVYTVSTDLGDDGNDHLLGQGGNDVMVGGGGDDILDGGEFLNVLIGDFADLKLSGTSLLLEVNATHIDSTFQGDDHLIGGAISDVLMGNGGRDILDGGMGNNVLIGDNANLEGNNLFKGVQTMVSLYDELDDADDIYTGLTQSLIVAGSGGMDGLTPVGDTITTGLSYGTGSTRAERMIIFADYGDLNGPQNAIGTLTTTFSVGDADIVNTTDGDDIIFGGVGDDQISSGEGSDIIFGDTGTYDAELPTEDDYDPRAGFTLTSEHDALHNPANAGASAQTVVGDDKISGGNGSNFVIAGGGADEITTGTGMDVIIGDLGSIRVFGKTSPTEIGPDIIATGSEPATADGDTWGDTIIAGLGDDIVVGGDGSDNIAGGATDEFDEGRLLALGDFGSVGAAILDADGNRVVHDLLGAVDKDGNVADPMARLEVMTADASNAGKGAADEIYGGADEDTLIGGDGDDLLYGYAGNDLLFGDHVNMAYDSVAGGYAAGGAFTDVGGADTIYGGDGNDVAMGGYGNDLIVLGEDNDIGIGDVAWVNIGARSVTTADPHAATGHELDATADGGVDTILGGDGDDVLIGGREGDTLIGNGGANAVFGDYADITWTGSDFQLKTIGMAADEVGGDDTIYTFNDADYVFSDDAEELEAGTDGDASSIAVGGRGTDHVYGTSKADMLVGDLAAFTLQDPGVVTGTAFARILTVDSQLKGEDDFIYGYAGRNIMIGGAGDDEIEGDADQDLIAGDHAAYGNDHEGGETFGSRLAEEGGDDTINAYAGNDIIIGGYGSETIDAGTGHDIVAGDTAYVDIGAGSLVTADPDALPGHELDSTAYGDDDTILGGDGDDLLIGGRGDDTVIGNGGANAVFGDYTDATWYGPDFRLKTIVLAADEIIGDDTLYVFNDTDPDHASGTDGDASGIAVGGRGEDEIHGASQADMLVGDLATFVLQNPATFGGNPFSRILDVTSLLKGEDDEIYGYEGRDILIGGAGDDTLDGAEDQDLLAGDHARYTDDHAGGETFGSQLVEEGGNDTIYGRDGNDIAIGGFGADRMEMETGHDIAAGDEAFIDIGNGVLVTADPDALPANALKGTGFGGADTILGGDGDDLIIGGGAGDTLVGNGGANVVLGDYADVTWFGPDFRVATIVLAADQVTGDDIIYTNNATDPDLASGSEADASSIAAGQRGDDTIVGGAQADFVAGDWVTFLLRDPAVYPGSAFDRIITVESIKNWIKDDDHIEGMGGRDVIIAGDGDDYVDGGEDQDLIAGDEAIYHRYYDSEGHELFESRFPFEGGDDVIKGGPGNDIIITGYFNFGEPGAGDLVYGNTVEDFLMAGAGSLYIHGALVEKFNYLGIAPNDNISNNQLAKSVGAQLRPNYERRFGDDDGLSPFEMSERELANLLRFAEDSPIVMPTAAEMQTIDALLGARILTDEILHLIELYKQGSLSLSDLDAELREALTVALFDAYGYRLPEPVVNMLDRFLELLYERLDIDATPADAAESAEAAEFARRFGEAFEAA